MKILITGGAGFIGNKICNKLKKNFKIIVLDNFLHQVHGDNSFVQISDVEYVYGDVTNVNDWKIVMSKNPDYIIHLASETGTGQSMEEITRYVNTNIMGTSIMLEYLNKNKHNVKKIILSSTRAVYGNLENNCENGVVDPKSVYAVTKLSQENLFKTSCNVPYTILRYQNVFGNGQSLNNPYTGIITIFSNLLLQNKSITIFDGGIATRDFIYVDDVADATIKCIENELSNYKTYDVGTGVETKILDVSLKLKYLFNSNSDIIISDYHRDGDVIFAKSNSDKIRKDLNWSPNFNIDEGLGFFYEWFKIKKNI